MRENNISCLLKLDKVKLQAQQLDKQKAKLKASEADFHKN